MPPKPYPAVPGEGQFWFGSKTLWTRLAVDGVWHGLHTELGYGNKLFWHGADFDGNKDLKRRVLVTGRRRDAGAPPFVTYANCCSSAGRRPGYCFMIAGVDIPTSGCWEIEGADRNQKLSFVVWVAP